MEQEKRKEGAEWALLPVELGSVILHIAVLHVDEMESLVARVVCSFVCHQWRDILQRRTARFRNPTSGIYRARFFNVAAAAAGYFSLLKWGREEGCRISSSVWSNVAKRGSIDMLM